MQTKTALIIGTPIIAILLPSVILSSTPVYADNAIDEVNITIPTSCTISGTGTTSHNVTIINGQYNSNIGETTIKVTCNDKEGFAIYAIGYTDNEDGKNVLTSSTLGSTYDIATGTATSGNTSNWAMKLSTISSPTPTYPITIQNSFDSFQPVPDDYTLVAKRTSSTDIGTGAEGSNLKTTYQAYISKTQPAGTYTGQVKYTLVHPNDAVAPEKPVACNPSGTTISTIICMQDISSTNKSFILNSMTLEQQYTLIDKRDEKTYTVAKLKDSNIWMTQNLDHDIKTDGTVIYDSTTTDLPSGTTWEPSTATYIASDTTWINSGTSPESYDPGDLYWNGLMSNAYSNPYSDYVSSTGMQQYHLGNYYNYSAAVAMNDTSGYTTQYDDIDQSICPSGWTLPKGGNNTGSGSFQYLLAQYGWTSSTKELSGDYKAYQAPLYFSLAGLYNILSLDRVGYNSLLRSSTIRFSGGAYYSEAYSNDAPTYSGGNLGDTINLDDYYYCSRSDGCSVRCLTR